MSAFLESLFDLLFRMLPHRAPTGLVAIGDPGPDSPVLVTGNYTLTIRRLRRALAGRDAWLLAANSNGINVWCAATGGHLTHHDVIAVIRTSGIAGRVDHRRLILPQLGATGIEAGKITAATGWQTRWGPARMEDLPAYLERGQRPHKAERFMRFPLWERLEMTLIWLGPLLTLGVPLVGLIGGWPAVAVFAGMLALIVICLFAALPWLKLHGRSRHLFFLLLVVLGALAAAGVLVLSGVEGQSALITTAVAVAGAIAILAVDFEGTTSWYGSVVATFGNQAHIAVDDQRCTAAADCILVCPKAVLSINGAGDQRIVEIERPEECVQCAACIVQCPSDALYFRYDDGRIATPEIIRSTRLNMLGKRTVQVE